MGLRILVGCEQGTDAESAVLFCSTSGVAFGPLMDSEEEAEAFIAYCNERGGDPRKFPIDTLMDMWAAFAKEYRAKQEA
jgi:hypothetical protein